MARVFALRLDGASLQSDGSVHLRVTTALKPLPVTANKQGLLWPSRAAFDAFLADVDRLSPLHDVMLAELLRGVQNPATKIGKVVEATVVELP